MAENVYEAMFIFDSNRFARDHAALPGEVEEMIKSGGGEVLVSRLWEERRLAYPINGKRKGTYWLVYFRSGSTLVDPLNRQCEINDGILRQLVLKIHPRLVEAVLAHASEDPHASEPEPEPKAVAKPAAAAVAVGAEDGAAVEVASGDDEGSSDGSES